MAWNEKTHIGVLSFRGTASLSNAIADIQASAQNAWSESMFGSMVQPRYAWSHGTHDVPITTKCPSPQTLWFGVLALVQD